MLKFHPIIACMTLYANFENIFLIRAFWFKHISPIRFKIRNLDEMLLPKNSVPYEGLHYSSPKYQAKIFVSFGQLLFF